VLIVSTIVFIENKNTIKGDREMGTRHFIGVISDGEYKIANYGQWDGYIEGQGAEVLKFLANADLDNFKKKLINCRFVDQCEIRQMYIDAGDAPDNTSGFVSMEVANRFGEAHPSLSRDTGAKILDIVYWSTSEIPLVNREDFLSDNVWCEFGYVIDLDRGTLKCYNNGKNLFAEYIFEDLPSVEQMAYDFEEYYKKANGESDMEEQD
jgi:hypothetical protein